MATVTVTFKVVDDQLVPGPIDDFLVKVFDDADVFVTEGMTGNITPGEIDFLLPADNPTTLYIVRFFRAGWIVQNGPTQLVEVLNPLPPLQTNIFDIVAAQPVIPQSSDQNMCLMSGYFVDVSLRPLKNLRLRFMPILNDPDVKMSGFPGAGDPAVVLRKQILNEVVCETNDEGYVEVSLPRASCYDVHLHGYELPGVPTYAQVYIPDAAGALIEDVLFPYPASVEFDPTSITMNVGENKMVTPTIIGSNTQVLQNQYSQMFMDFTVADPTIAQVAIGADGAVQLTGLLAGSTTLTAARSSTKSTYVSRRPDVPALVVTPVPITVS